LKVFFGYVFTDAGVDTELPEGNELSRLFIKGPEDRPVKIPGRSDFSSGNGGNVFGVDHHPLGFTDSITHG